VQRRVNNLPVWKKLMVTPARLTILTKPAIAMKTKIMLLVSLCSLSFLAIAQTSGASVGGGVHSSAPATSGSNHKIRSTGPA
jgi:hypothetical protein